MAWRFCSDAVILAFHKQSFWLRGEQADGTDGPGDFCSLTMTGNDIRKEQWSQRGTPGGRPTSDRLLEFMYKCSEAIAITTVSDPLNDTYSCFHSLVIKERLLM